MNSRHFPTNCSALWRFRDRNAQRGLGQALLTAFGGREKASVGASGGTGTLDQFPRASPADDLAVLDPDQPIGIGQRAVIVGDDQDRRGCVSLATSARSAITPLPFSLSRAAVGSSARITDGEPASARAIATRCFSPPLSLLGHGVRAMRKPDLPQRLGGERRAPRDSRAAAQIERQHDVLRRRQRRHQVVGLEDEADVLAAQVGEALGRQPAGRRCAPMRSVPALGVRMQPRIDSSVVLPLPEGPISRVSSPGIRSRLTPFSGLHLGRRPRPGTSRCPWLRAWVLLP